MKKLQELRNEILNLRNIGELTKQTESILLHKLNALEEQLSIGSVSITLPSDTDLNNYKIDLKTPLDNFYYYHRPNMVDEQPAFRESLQKALNYVKGN